MFPSIFDSLFGIPKTKKEKNKKHKMQKKIEMIEGTIKDMNSCLMKYRYELEEFRNKLKMIEDGMINERVRMSIVEDVTNAVGRRYEAIANKKINEREDYLVGLIKVLQDRFEKYVITNDLK